MRKRGSLGIRSHLPLSNSSSRLTIPSDRVDFDLGDHPQRPQQHHDEARSVKRAKPAMVTAPIISDTTASPSLEVATSTLFRSSQDRVCELERQNEDLQMELACLRSENQISSTSSQPAAAAAVVPDHSSALAELQTQNQTLEQNLKAAKQEIERKSAIGLQLENNLKCLRLQQDLELDIALLMMQSSNSEHSNMYHVYSQILSGKQEPNVAVPILVRLVFAGNNSLELRLAGVRILYCLMWRFPNKCIDDVHRKLLLEHIIDLFNQPEDLQVELDAALLRLLVLDCTLHRETTDDVLRVHIRSMHLVSRLTSPHALLRQAANELFMVLPFPKGFPDNLNTWDQVPCPFPGGVESIQRSQLILARFGKTQAMAFLLSKNPMPSMIRELYLCACENRTMDMCESTIGLFFMLWNALKEFEAAAEEQHQLLCALLWVQEIPFRPALCHRAQQVMDMLSPPQ